MKISAVMGDVCDVPVDILVMKHAEVYRGADLAVADKLGLRDQPLLPGEYRMIQSQRRIAAEQILFIDVGPLGDFDYNRIRDFAADAVRYVETHHPHARTIGITLHGPGYGLDELASIDSLVKGLLASNASGSILDVKIIERNRSRFSRVQSYLASLSGSSGKAASEFSPDSAEAISSGGTYEKRLFAAMPFSENFLDHWEFALQPAAHASGVVIERLDHEHYIGDVLTEIRRRIERAAAVIAILDDGNPNVFLEVGYAWGVKTPTILLMHKRFEAPFDVSGHKLIVYSRLGELRSQLENALQGLLLKNEF